MVSRATFDQVHDKKCKDIQFGKRWRKDRPMMPQHTLTALSSYFYFSHIDTCSQPLWELVPDLVLLI